MCDTFSGKSIASFFQEPTWIKSYLTITEQNDRLWDLICVDWDAATEAKLKKFVKKLEQEVKEGIPLDPSTSPVSYKRELDDKVKEYNSWAISWLDGFSTGMEKAVDGCDLGCECFIRGLLFRNLRCKINSHSFGLILATFSSGHR